jgi:hypothetical protein
LKNLDEPPPRIASAKAFDIARMSLVSITTTLIERLDLFDFDNAVGGPGAGTAPRRRRTKSEGEEEDEWS